MVKKQQIIMSEFMPGTGRNIEEYSIKIPILRSFIAMASGAFGWKSDLPTGGRVSIIRELSIKILSRRVL